jgi:hypothetical protein
MQLIWGFGGAIVCLTLGLLFGTGIKSEISALRTDLTTHVASIVTAIKSKI